MNYQNGEDLFKAIINNPKVITTLPTEYRYDIDFLETYYIILGDEIKPYIPNDTFKILKHREIVFKNQNLKQLQNKPNITLDDELQMLHNVLTDPKTIETLPTDEKYNNDALELLYTIWGDAIEPYIPYEMFEEIKNEELM